VQLKAIAQGNVGARPVAKIGARFVNVLEMSNKVDGRAHHLLPDATSSIPTQGVNLTNNSSMGVGLDSSSTPGS
jgi:hypothetical protein